MNKNIVGLIVFVVFAMMTVPHTVFAHYASITLDNYHPAPGEEVTIHIGFGHNFPADGQMRRAAYEKTNLEIIDPEGKSRQIAVVPEGDRGNQPIHVKFEKTGSYTILLTKKNFSTKTTKGYKYLPKHKCENALHSKWSETVSKAVVNVGASGESDESADAMVTTDDRFQIIPLQNPLEVGKGDMLPVKITLDGEPWRGMVYATYAGFSDSKDTFAYTTRTDKQGIGEIRMIEKGMWLIKADHSYPYEDTDAAEEYSLTATLTFKN